MTLKHLLITGYHGYNYWNWKYKYNQGLLPNGTDQIAGFYPNAL